MTAALDMCRQEEKILSHLRGSNGAVPEDLFNRYVSGIEEQIARSRRFRETYGSQQRERSTATSSFENNYAIRLKKLYQTYAPEKVTSIPVMLETFSGREKYLIDRLVNQYGPEPEDDEVCSPIRYRQPVTDNTANRDCYGFVTDDVIHNKVTLHYTDTENNDNRRKQQWPTLLCDKNYKHHYTTTLNQFNSLSGQPHSSTTAINKDIQRTFPDCIHYEKDGSGVADLVKCLNLVSISIEDGYCQGMNFITGLLLLLLDVEETFAAVHAIATNERYNLGYYSVKMANCTLDQKVLTNLVQKKFPEVMSRLECLCVSLSDLFIKWFLTIFIDCFPLQTVLRLWDVYFEVGLPFIFSFILSFVDEHQSDLIAAEDLSSVIILVRERALELVDVELLINKAKSTHSLSLSDLKSLRQDSLAQQQQEEAEIAQRREALRKKREAAATVKPVASPGSKLKGFLKFNKKK